MGFSIAQKIVTVAKVLSQQEDAQTTKHKSFNNVVGFYCPSAGAGVTTLVGNIAVMLAAQKKNVCIVDLNILFPEQMRYFLDEKMEKKMKSLTEKILKPNMHMRELINSTKVQGVSLVSTKFADSIVTLINIREDAIIAMFNELREMFDYVLLDMGGIDIAYESTTIAFDHCDYVYTVIAPQLGMVNGVLKINNFLSEANYGVKLTRVLQNQIKDKPFKQSEFKQLGLSLLADMPYSEEIRQIGARFQFCCTSSSGSKTLSAYLSVLAILCKNIIQMADVRNFSAAKDGSIDESTVASVDRQISDNLGDVTGDEIKESETTVYEDLVGKRVDGVTGVPGGLAGMPPGTRPPVPGVQPGIPSMPQSAPMAAKVVPGQPGVAPQGAQQQFAGQPGVPPRAGMAPGMQGAPGMMPGGIPQPGVLQPGVNPQGIPQQPGFPQQQPRMPSQPGIPQQGMTQQGVQQPGQFNQQIPGQPQMHPQPGMPQQGPPPGVPGMQPNLTKVPGQPVMQQQAPAQQVISQQGVRPQQPVQQPQAPRQPQPTQQMQQPQQAGRPQQSAARKTTADIDWESFI